MATENYYGNVNPTLLEVVDPRAQRVCEFGCGAGAFAHAVKQRCAGVHYVGVELMADQLAMAKSVLDIGLVRNLDLLGDGKKDAELSDALPFNQFDHVIFGDVLEHLDDPLLALSQAKLRLSDNGTALVCMPNVQHWSVLAQLILGSWPQAESGIFDKTHRRWFTLSDMVKLMESAGLKVTQIVPRIFSPEKGAPLIAAMEKATQLLGVNHQKFSQLSMPLQYVLVGKKSTA
jgi:2-polyprenyl-3-methyl-5-hydroxy-6-metoxy-1,4-benzoquinol methylase